MKEYNNLKRRLLIWGAAFSVASCIEPFEPQVATSTKNLLVVDGFINSAGKTRIRLSRATAIGSATAPLETKVQVYIEDEASLKYPLREVSAGSYVSDSLQLTLGKRYRIHMLTATRQEYASEFVSTKVTPPIDSISWKHSEGGIKLFVNSHDPTNQTRYYRWDYAETWEYYAKWVSYYDFKLPREIIDRQQLIDHCWKTEKPTNILLFSTSKLTQDIVSEYPLCQIPATSTYKLRQKYSILVRQYAQTEEEYAYWEQLRKNTELNGTLFDPLPSQLTGNVRSLSNPGEVVIGYVGAYSSAEKRLFIAPGDLPPDIRLLTGYENCGGLDTILSYESIITLLKFNPNAVLVVKGQDPLYLVSTTDCADCRKRGGVLQKPAFWQ